MSDKVAKNMGKSKSMAKTTAKGNEAMGSSKEAYDASRFLGVHSKRFLGMHSESSN